MALSPFAPSGVNMTAELEKKIGALQKEIEKKDGNIAELHNTVAHRDIAMEEMQALSKVAISIKDETIELQAKRLREADDAAEAHQREVAELEAEVVSASGAMNVQPTDIKG